MIIVKWHKYLFGKMCEIWGSGQVFFLINPLKSLILVDVERMNGQFLNVWIQLRSMEEKM